MIAGAAIAGLAIASYGFCTSEAALGAARLVTGVGQGLFFTGAATLVSDIAPPSRRGEAMSYFSVAAYMGTGLGPLFGQLLAERVGVVGVFRIAGCFCLAGALLSLRAPNYRVPAPPTPRRRRFSTARASAQGSS